MKQSYIYIWEVKYIMIYIIYNLYIKINKYNMYHQDYTTTKEKQQKKIANIV